jgi:hypothetical protein
VLERAAVTAGWVAAVPPECSSHWQRDLELCLTHEKVKSADGVRYARRDAGTARDTGERRALAARLAAKLAAAHPHLDGGPRRSPAEVEEIMRGWVGDPQEVELLNSQAYEISLDLRCSAG